MIQKTTQVEVDSKFAIRYIVVSKTGMKFADNNGFFATIGDAVRLREKCNQKFPTIAPFVIYREITTLQTIDSAWDILNSRATEILNKINGKETSK